MQGHRHKQKKDILQNLEYLRELCFYSSVGKFKGIKKPSDLWRLPNDLISKELSWDDPIFNKLTVD